MSRLFIISFVCAFALFTFSCSRNNEGKPINLYGGPGRTNSYEELGSIYKAITITEKPESDDSSGAVSPPLAFSASQVVIATANGSILMTDGKKVNWLAKLDSNSIVGSAMCADASHNIYAVSDDGVVWSYTVTGKLRWKFSLEKSQLYCDLLVLDDLLVAGGVDGFIYGISLDGKLKWKYQSSFNLVNSFASDKSSNIIIPLTQNTTGATDSLICLGKNGNVRWRKAFDGIRFINPPSIEGDRIYISGIQSERGNNLSILYSLDTLGNTVWKKELSIIIRHISIAKDGTVYLVVFNSGIGETISGIYCFSRGGEVKWNLFYQTIIPAPAMITENEIVLLGVSRNGAEGMYFMSREGKLGKVLTISNGNILYNQPAFTPEGITIFAASDKLAIERIDETPLNKIIPW